MAAMDSNNFILSQQAQWREQLVDRLSWFLVVIALPLLIYAILERSTFDWGPPLVFYGVLVLLALVRHRFLMIRAVALCSLLFAAGILAIYNHGLESSGILFLGMSVILSSILVNPRFGVIAFSVSSLLYGFIGWAVIAGHHTLKVNEVPASVDPASWVLYWGSYVLVIGMGLLVGIYLYSRVTKTITRLHDANLKTEAAEEAEQASNQHFKFLTENLPDVVWTMDLDMNFTYISPSVQFILGYTPEEAIALGILNISHSASPGEVRAFRTTMLEEDTGVDSEHPVTVESTLRHKQGGSTNHEMTVRFTREKDGTPNGFIGVTRDVSERKQLERAMLSVISGTQRKVGTDFLNSLAENLAAVLDIKCVLVGELLAKDVAKTLSIWVDNKFGDNFESTLVGTPSANLADEVICIYPENVQAQFPEDDLLREMGIESYLGASLLDNDGKNIGILVCMDDKPMISLKFRRELLSIFSVHASSELSRRQALEEGEVIKRQLLQAQKMESIGQMAGGVAHDFNNLLVVIKGYTDLAEEKTRDDPELSRYHNQILGAADRANDLTTKLLSFSSRQIMDTQPLDLNVLMKETGNLLQRLLPENITYELIPGANLGVVDGDAGQLEQSVINLAVNARDAMPEGGKLTIETENIIIDGNYVETHPWAKIGRYVLLRVSDSGTGIPEDIQDLVFEPFFTTKPEGSGTGLGLSVLFGVIKQHGGYTHFYSETDKGTEFRIYLPIVERTATSLNRKLEAKVTRGDETVLLVEDNDQVRTLANTFLSLAGYKVLLAEDGEMAIHKFRQFRHEISIVVLDVVLPKTDGREVMEEIHKLSPELPVLFCSGYSANGIHTNFILEKDLVLLQKPYSRDDLLRKIRELLD